MDVQAHWERIYSQKAADEVSWYCPHLETSLALIAQAASSPSASIIDVGGGESTLVDDLLARGYADITLLDIRKPPSMRLGNDWARPRSGSVGWWRTLLRWSWRLRRTRCGGDAQFFIRLEEPKSELQAPVD